MTTVQITLPDALAQEAQRAGLLAPERVEKWLRDELKSKAWGELTEIMDRIGAVPDSAPMSLDEIAEEVKKVRAEGRSDLAK